jgi:uncharacterized delta-60 repeat protein
MKTNFSFVKKNRGISIGLAMLIAFLTSTNALAADGSLDPTFGTNGIVITDLGSNTDSGNAVILQSDGKIIMAGSAQLDAANPFHRTPIIVRYHSNGTVDTSFGAGGGIITEVGSFSGSKIAIQSDGKLIVAGSSQGDFALARYNSNGSLDTSFGQNGIATLHFLDDSSERCSDVAIQSDGRIILAGYQEIGNFVYYAIARFNNDGTPDTTFNTNGIEIVDFPNNRYNYGKAVEIQADGKIIMSGSFTDNDGYGPKISLARFNEDGSLDNTFGVQGTVTTGFANFQNNTGALALQADGRILVAGISFNTTDDLAVARFNSNGALDTTFGGSGIAITDFGNNESGNSVVIQPDGKIIAVGNINDNDFADFMLVRYNSNGSLDNTFGSNGKLISDFGNHADNSAGSVVQPDKKIIVIGSSGGNAILARYDTGTTTAVTVTFRSTGTYDGWILESAENSNTGGSLDKSATTINVGDDPQDRQYRSILSFNTSSIPDNVFVTSAQLNIKRQGLVGTDPFTTHGNLLLDIRNSAFSNDIALQLDDFAAPASEGAVQDSVTANTFSWYTANLNTGNLGLINKAGATQFRLLFSLDDNDDMNADYMKFFSGNATVEADQPQLIITYVTSPPTTSPTVIGITRANTDPSGETNVDFTVTFSESVTGVDAADFTLTTTGVSGPTVSGVSGSGSVYTVTVNTGSGSGTIRLDVMDDDTILNGVGIPLGGAGTENGNFTNGETYTITKSWIFGDVPASYWANSWIERLYNAGITGGCSTVPLYYCPDATVTRAQMAIFILRGIHGSTYTPPPATGTVFGDVPLGSFAADWIEQLYAEDVTGGCGNGNYCPDATITRAQMAIFLLRGEHGSAYAPPAATGTVFGDVPLGSFADAWIEQLALEGITGGCGGGNYCPDNSVTRAEMAVFLVRAFNLP